MDRASKPVPEGIIQLQRQLEQFRSTHPLRTKLPEAIWLSAVELARQHGVNSVAYPLRLDYAGLKRRLSGTSGICRKKSKPAFVELVTPPVQSVAECTLEVEGRGGKLRIQLRGASASYLATLSWELVESAS